MVSSRRLGSTVSALWTDLRRDGRGGVLLFVSAGWFSTLGVRIVYPALLPQIARTFAIDYATVGALIGVLWMSYALLQFPGGMVADIFGERTVLMASVSLALLAVVALVLAPVFGLFVAATVVLGVGTGLYGTSRITVLSDTFPDRDTTAISVSQAAGNVGNVILPVLAGLFSVALGWRMGFGYLIPVFAVTVVGIRVFLPKRTSAPTDVTVVQTTRAVAATITRKRVLLATGVLFLIMIEYQSITGFLPTYLVEVKDLPQDAAATLYGLFFASAIGVQFVSGVVSDRYGRRLALGGSLAASVPAFALLTVAEGIVALAGVVMLLSCVLGGFPPAHAYAVGALPSEIQGSGYGLVRTLYIALGATGPPTVGLLADSGLFDGAFLLLGGVAVLATGTILALPSLE